MSACPRRSTGLDRDPPKVEAGGSIPSEDAIFRPALMNSSALFGTLHWLVKWRGKFA